MNWKPYTTVGLTHWKAGQGALHLTLRPSVVKLRVETDRGELQGYMSLYWLELFLSVPHGVRDTAQYPRDQHIAIQANDDSEAKEKANDLINLMGAWLEGVQPK